MLVIIVYIGVLKYHDRAQYYILAMKCSAEY